MSCFYYMCFKDDVRQKIDNLFRSAKNESQIKTIINQYKLSKYDRYVISDMLGCNVDVPALGKVIATELDIKKSDEIIKLIPKQQPQHFNPGKKFCYVAIKGKVCKQIDTAFRKAETVAESRGVVNIYKLRRFRNKPYVTTLNPDFVSKKAIIGVKGKYIETELDKDDWDKILQYIPYLTKKSALEVYI